MSVLECLKDVRRIIEHGWCQGGYHIDNDYCLVGAIQAASKNNLITWGDVTNLVCEKVGHHPGAIPEWNDAPERTKEDVLVLLDELIGEVSPCPSE